MRDRDTAATVVIDEARLLANQSSLSAHG
jgi:hypothetical protein